MSGTTYAAFVPVATTYGNSVYIAMSNNGATILYTNLRMVRLPVVGGILKRARLQTV
ncbi:MAG: hypothetical protein ACLTTW_11000 [Coprobacter sp.]